MHPGHLFVLRGDLTTLACDAVVVPTSSELHVTQAWKDLVPLRSDRPGPYDWYEADVAPPPGWGEQVRAVRSPRRHLDREVWLARTDAWTTGSDWVAQSLVEAVRRAAQEPGPEPSRARRLVGVPLAGTGAGGMRHRRGEVVKAVVPALEAVAREQDVDVVLVLDDDRDHAAVQASRTWLPDEAPQLDEADRLGGLAASGHLVLFLGAGVSLAAGLPTWSQLLRELGQDEGLSGVRIDHLSAQDAAQVAAQALGDRFLDIMTRRFRLERHTLAHGLLTGLRVDSAITTNYDNGYELAAGALFPQGSGLRVLPREQAQPGAPWLLKMHGDVARPSSIVLTRDHYLEYGDERAPLSGVVQAALLTRHVLFVGFSLQDGNVARLAHQVRRLLAAQGATSAERIVGTLLALREDPARRLLWEHDLTHVAMAGPPPREEGRDAAAAADREAARLLEVFLDRMAWRATTERGGPERYLLDERYDALDRPDADRRLRDLLRGLIRAVEADPDVRTSRAWSEVARALAALGDTRQGPAGW